MKKLVFMISMFYLLFSCLYAERIKKESVTDDERKQLMMNLNYIEYSVAQISEYKNKAVADSEYKFIINKISPESLLDSDIIAAYTQLSKLATEVSLKDNEKQFVKKQAEKKRKQAVTSVFKSAGSVFVPGASPQQMIASLAYTSVSAALNYMDTVNEIENSLEKEFFEIDQSLLKNIQDYKSELFEKSRELANKYELIWDQVIEDNEMQKFVETLKLSNDEKISGLDTSGFRKTFALFPPYWFELGNAFQNKKNYPKANEYYNHFEQLMSYKIIKNNNQYCKYAKNKILLLLGVEDSFEKMVRNAKKYKTEILNYIDIINEQTPKTVEDQIEKNCFLSKIYFMIGMKDIALSCLDYVLNNKKLGAEYLDECILLKRLILESENSKEGELYRLVSYYSQIAMGDDSTDSIITLQNQLYQKSGVKNILKSKLPAFISSRFNNSDQIDVFNLDTKENYIDLKNMYFELPEYLKKDTITLLEINSKQYVPAIVSPREEFVEEMNSIYYFDYELNSITEEPMTFKINAYNDSSLSDYTITYKIQKLSKKNLDKVNVAFSRIGSDLSSVNSDVLLEYIKMIRNYKYKVDDIEKERKSIEEQLRKENKKSKNTMSTYRFTQEINRRLQESLLPDIEKLNKYLSEATLSVYAGNLVDIPYSTSIIKIGDENYAISLIGMQIDEQNYIIDSNGAIVLTETEETNAINSDIKDLYKEALLGKSASQFEYGRRLYEGIGSPINYTEAVKWFYRAANKGYAEAYKYLGSAYAEGKGVSKNKDASINWYLKASENGISVDKKSLK